MCLLFYLFFMMHENVIRVEYKKTKKSGEEGVVLKEQTSYLPHAFQFARKKATRKEGFLLFACATEDGAKKKRN